MKCTLSPAAEMSFKYSSSKKVFAFLMLVVTEWTSLCGSWLFPDFEMRIFISARVNMGTRARLDDQPSEGNFTEITDGCTVTSALQLLHCCVHGTAAFPSSWYKFDPDLGLQCSCPVHFLCILPPCVYERQTTVDILSWLFGRFWAKNNAYSVLSFQTNIE